jgi:hypothetical protein
MRVAKKHDREFDKRFKELDKQVALSLANEKSK